MKAYSLDLRQRVVAAYEQGELSIPEVAEKFQVGQTFVKKMLRQKRELGDVAPRAHGGGKPPLLSEKEHRLLRQKVAEQADITLNELQEYLQSKAKLTVSRATIARSLLASGLSHKKRALVAAERNAHKRAWYWRRLNALDHRRLRFIDETGVNITLTRRYGRAGRGERVTESVPKNYRQSTSVISALSLDATTVSLVLDGAVDTLAFDAYVEQVLQPTIRTGDILVLDNLAAHRASQIEEVATGCGAQVIWLSPYSPDFSPIEMMWSKLKAHLRKAKARTEDEVAAALSQGLGLITRTDCQGWFQHCGYSVAPD